MKEGKNKYRRRGARAKTCIALDSQVSHTIIDCFAL